MREFDKEDVGIVEKDTARRLRQTRLALFYADQDEFAADAELEQSRYSRFESGGRRISLDAAMQLVKHHALSLDWIYYGDSNALDPRVWNRIKLIRKNELWRDEKAAMALLKSTFAEDVQSEHMASGSPSKRKR